MSIISESYKDKILKKYNLNIKTKYIVGNKILIRNTNNLQNDDIVNGIICKKEYFLNNNLIHTENLFDSRIEYTFISKDQENGDYTCPNCGMHSKLKSFLDGCPYCRTQYNIDYVNKQLGSKHHYDLVLKSNLYRIITGIIDFIVSLLLSFIFIKYTSRTFNSYDISKVFIYGFILALILYYFFYLLDAYVILGPIKRYKERENEKQISFWNDTKIDKVKLFNNLIFEINKYYYNSKNDIIDYDILDYVNFKLLNKNNTQYVNVCVQIRLVYFKNNKIISKYLKESFLLKKNNKEIIKLKEGANLIKCSNCGASIQAIKGKCDFCHTDIGSLQEWVLE